MKLRFGAVCGNRRNQQSHSHGPSFCYQLVGCLFVPLYFIVQRALVINGGEFLFFEKALMVVILIVQFAQQKRALLRMIVTSCLLTNQPSQIKQAASHLQSNPIVTWTSMIKEGLSL